MSAAPSPELWDGFLPSPASPASLRTAHLAGQRILVTGAGGYIGSALVRALAASAPERLILLDLAEYGLYQLEQHLRREAASLDTPLIVGSVCDEALLRDLFAEHRPHIVFHAAALKHVPLMETNPFAAAETNALGTEMLVRAARTSGTAQLVLLSTDKAVDPINVMGATKRIAELIVLATSRAEQPLAMSAAAVRLVNVLGSSGSVAPLFADQIARGENVTVTDRDATRHFLSLGEIVSTLIAAAAPSTRGLLLPVVGSPYRIDELARHMIARAGNASESAQIIYTGLRPGDKLHEQIVSTRESLLPQSPARNFVQVESPALAEPQLTDVLERLRGAVQARDLPGLERALRAAVPEYTPAPRVGSRPLIAHETTR